MAEHGDTEKVWDLVEGIAIALFVTRDGERLRARPMGAYVRRKENAIYFLSDIRQHKDDEIAAEPQVCVAFHAGEDYVSMSGRASVSNDRATIRELFDLPAKAWWDSPEDANIRLIKFLPEAAEYWDAPGKLVAYTKMAVAAATGGRPDLGDHAKTQM